MEFYTETSESTEPASRLSYSRMSPEQAEAAFQRRKEELKRLMKGGAVGAPVAAPVPAAHCFKNITESFAAAPHKRSQSHSRPDADSKSSRRTNTRGVDAGRTESLFRRHVEWKQKAVEKADQMRKINSEKEMENCTFNPHLAKPVGQHLQFIQLNPQGKVHERAELWAKEKERKTEEMKEMASERELEDCTFHPKVKSQSKTFDSNAYFQRQISWKKEVGHKIAALDAKVHSHPPPAKPPKCKAAAPEKDTEARMQKLQQALGVLEDRVNSSLGLLES